MTKMTVLQHREALINLRLYRNRLAQEFDRLSQQLADVNARIEKKELQIDRALREGKVAFDEDKFEPLPTRLASTCGKTRTGST